MFQHQPLAYTPLLTTPEILTHKYLAVGVVFLCSLRERKKHININKFAGLSRDWVGAKNLFYVFFFRVIPYGREKTHKQNSPQKSRDNPVKILFTCFFSLCVFFAPYSPALDRAGKMMADHARS